MPITNLVIILFVLAMIYMGTVQGLFSSFLHLMVVIAAGALAFAVWEPLTLGLLMKHILEPPPPVMSRAPNLDPRLGPLVDRMLASRPMVWLGEISYEVFLLHVLVMAVVLGEVLRWPLFTGSMAGLFAATLAVTLPLAWLLRRLTARVYLA